MNRVGLLVKKDLIYLFTSLKRLILMAVIFAFIMPIGNITFSLVVPVMMAYLLTYGLFAYEEKNKMHLLNAALPVNRKEICLSKYVGACIYIGGSLLVTIMGTGIALGIQNAGGDELTLSFAIKMIGLLFTTALIYHAFILPMLMYFGTIKIKYVMFILYVGAFIAVGSLGGGQGEGLGQVQLFLQEKMTYNTSLTLVLVGIILYILSYILDRKSVV